MASKAKTDKKQHIQVFTRVRPLSSQEVRSHVVVDCPSSKEVSVKDKGQTRTFTFDKVFGPDSKQIDVYKTVVNPLISEVLQGYNCTVFAYGQTGTGKTYTMVGDKMQDDGKGWENDPGCGIIPRTLSHLFDELKVRAEEFTVRVSFLELYNEELCDLLAPNENLRLFEDSTKKGSVIVSGLEERTVHNKDDVYTILDTGNLRRQTAQTLMNSHSSRSHTIFTVTVFIKVPTPGGEDLIKTGKLNLVDLAGSENIGRSGAVDMRAREAGNINQSLLTLGRVITCLVERAPHVPYRESKLTRILQDSLGGRTKTSIIATISPAQCNLEETLSTLDYAHRARNITNKPEINQKTSKKALIKEYTEEIERLRRDLISAREKHGVYLALENYNAMVAERENLNKEVVTKINLLKVREEEMLKQEDIMKSLNMDLASTQNHLENTEIQLEQTTLKLESSEKMCLEKQMDLEQLAEEAKIVLKTADQAISDTQRLHDRLERSKMINKHNTGLNVQFKANMQTSLSEMKQWVQEQQQVGVNGAKNAFNTMEDAMQTLSAHDDRVQNYTGQLLSSFKGSIQGSYDIFNDQARNTLRFLDLMMTTVNANKEMDNNVLSSLMESLKLLCADMMTDLEKLHNHLRTTCHSLEEQCLSLQLAQSEVEAMKCEVGQTLETVKSTWEEREVAWANAAVEVEKFNEELIEIEKDDDEFDVQLQALMEAAKTRRCRRTQLREESNATRLKCVKEEVMALNTLNNQLQTIASGADKHACTALDVIKSVDQKLLTLRTESDSRLDIADHLAALQTKQRTSVETEIKKVVDTQRTQHDGLVEMSKQERLRLQGVLAAIAEDKELQMTKMEAADTEVADQRRQRDALLTESRAELNKQLQRLVADVSAQCERLFSVIHDQYKKVDWFEERTQRDDRTGQTPQRREFPMRILSIPGATRNMNGSVKISDSTADRRTDLNSSLN